MNVYCVCDSRMILFFCLTHSFFIDRDIVWICSFFPLHPVLCALFAYLFSLIDAGKTDRYSVFFVCWFVFICHCGFAFFCHWNDGNIHKHADVDAVMISTRYTGEFRIGTGINVHVARIYFIIDWLAECAFLLQFSVQNTFRCLTIWFLYGHYYANGNQNEILNDSLNRYKFAWNAFIVW